MNGGGAAAVISMDAPVKERAMQLVGLSRQATAMAEQYFNALPLDEQKQLVLSISPEHRLDLLNLPVDATALVQSLPELELHRTVQTAGKWEALEVVEVASEDQINFMLDHDCWRGESLDSRKFTDWLQLFLDCDEHQTARILMSINADLLALALKKHVRFEKDFMISDVYYLDPDWVKGSNPVVQMFLERLYSMDPNLWIRLLGWVRLHNKGTIEADAIEGREGRLKGKGYPAPTLAITVYYPVEFDFKPTIAQWRVDFQQPDLFGDSALPVRNVREVPFLQRAMRRLAESGVGDEFMAMRWEAELVDVANKVMVADQVDIGDMRKQREAVDKVRRWISIGLEAFSGGGEEAGAELLKQKNCEYFFRVGAMLFDQLGTAAVELAKIEQRTGGRLAASDYAGAYFALTEPEPVVPVNVSSSVRRTINTLTDYRYAWTLAWTLEAIALPTPVVPPVATDPANPLADS